MLVEHFLGIFNRELGKSVVEVPDDVMELLLRYPWPGNIRELQSVLRQSLLQATGQIILPEFLPFSVSGGGQTVLEPSVANDHAFLLDAFVGDRLRAGSKNLHAEALAMTERLVLTRVLHHTGGNQSRAAKILGITGGSLRSKICALGIVINQAVHVEEQVAPSARPAGGDEMARQDFGARQWRPHALPARCSPPGECHDFAEFVGGAGGAARQLAHAPSGADETAALAEPIP